MSDGQQGSSGLDRVREELNQLIDTGTQRLIDKVGDKLVQVAQGAGGAAAKSAAPQQLAKQALKGAVPGMGGGGEDGDGGGGGGGGAAGKLKGLKDHVPGLGGDGEGGKGGGDGEDGGGDSQQEAGDTKVTNIVETIDVGVPLRTCYDHWTQFEQFGVFMKGVSNVSASDETTTEWKVKIAFSERSFEATIDEQVPDNRIVWRSEGSKGTTRGAVSFHELTPTLTRIVAVIEYYPSGFFEKTGNLWRAVGRRMRLDLKHFQRYVTLAPDPDVQGWRGEIRDGEVVRGGEDDGGDGGEDDGDGNDQSNGSGQ